MVPTAILLLVSQLQATDSVSDALRTSVGGVVAMVPEGLVLLTSVAFAVGVVRLGKVNMLVQELPAVEGLARVDVLCLDKTGTLTEGAIAVQSVETIGGGAESVQDALGRARRRRSFAERDGARAARGVPLAPGLAGNGRDPVRVRAEVERGRVRRARLVVPRRARRPPPHRARGRGRRSTPASARGSRSRHRSEGAWCCWRAHPSH